MGDSFYNLPKTNYNDNPVSYHLIVIDNLMKLIGGYMKKKIVALLVAFTFFLTACSSTKEVEEKPILLQGAMDVEVETMTNALEEKEELHLGKYIYYKGTIDDYPVIVSKTNVGIANSAASTTLAIEEFDPTIIINQGTAGGHDPELHRMDVVVGEHIVNMGAFKTDFQEKGEGVDPAAFELRETEVLTKGKGQATEVQEFTSDETLVNLAIDRSDAYTAGKVVKGTIGTADEWNNQLDRIDILHTKLGTSAEEMESAAVAQMAYNYSIPYLGIRVLSNTAVHDEDFDPQSAVDLQEYVVEIVKAYISEQK